MGAFDKIVGAVCIFGAVCYFASDDGPTVSRPQIGPPVLPSNGTPSTPRVLVVYADKYGQFWIDGRAGNGTALRFLVDTGASDIVLSKRLAALVGIDVNRLHWDGRASTANGVTRTATARLSRLTLGPFAAADVEVTINEGQLGMPLLGMAFLRRMNVVIGNGTLTLSTL